MNNNVNARRKLFTEVRSLGFKEEFRVRGTRKITGLTQLICERGHRFLRIQICDNGNHNVSHGTYGNVGGKCETTLPTEFKTVHEMWRAIAFEWQRPSRNPNEPLE